MRGRRGRTLLAVGAVVLVAVAGGVGLSRATENGGNSAARSGFCADMPDAIGLYAGNPVTQMGFRIGKVSDVTEHETYVRVSFELDGNRRLPADVKAVTRSKSLLADRSLELVGNYRKGAELTAGKCIALDSAFTPKSISEVTGSASDFLEELSDADTRDLQRTLEGVDEAMTGTGARAAKMFRQAAAASRNPDRFISDIGSSIEDMAPLTENALAQWDQIMSIVDQMPSVAAKGTVLFDYVSAFDRGVGWTVATVYDIQRNYGDILWPLLHGPVTDIISLASARVGDLQELYQMVPSIAAALKQQESAAGGISVPYRAPGVKVSAAQCAVLGPVCNGGRTTTVNLFNLMLAKAGI